MDLQQALEPSRDQDWLLVEQSYDPVRESSIESRFTVSNGFLGVRAAREISRGPTWVSWSHTLRWASWPRTYVAGLFDTPNIEPPVPALVPVPDWLRVRVLVNGSVLRHHNGDSLRHQRILDMRRGVMLTEWQQRDSSGIVVKVKTLRLVSMADRAVGLQLVRLEVEQANAEITADARFDEFGLRSGPATPRAGFRFVAHRTVRQEPRHGVCCFAAIGRRRIVAPGAEPVSMVLELDIGGWSGRIFPAPDCRGARRHTCRRPWQAGARRVGANSADRLAWCPRRT